MAKEKSPKKSEKKKPLKTAKEKKAEKRMKKAGTSSPGIVTPKGK